VHVFTRIEIEASSQRRVDDRDLGAIDLGLVGQDRRRLDERVFPNSNDLVSLRNDD